MSTIGWRFEVAAYQADKGDNRITSSASDFSSLLAQLLICLLS
jgi:hypothetical protein